jgi:hypothetical protein
MSLKDARESWGSGNFCDADFFHKKLVKTFGSLPACLGTTVL